MTTALPTHDEAPAWLPTRDIPVQRVAPPAAVAVQQPASRPAAAAVQQPASRPEARHAPQPRSDVRPERTAAGRAEPLRRGGAALGGVFAGLVAGSLAAFGVALAMSAPSSPAVPTPVRTANVSVPGRTSTAFGDGTWQVGVDVAPGTYATAGSAGGSCFHALRAARTDGDAQSSAVSRGPATVVLREGWFQTFGCATWNRVS
jgi:hypothetical protein